MKNLSPELQAHLDSGTTTLCWCWRLARRDGVVMGFTDHDKAIMFDGTSYEAASGFTASEITDSVGLSVDNLEVDAALSSGVLTEADLAGGAYDEARVEIYRVNWADPDQHVLMRAGSLGEVQRTGQAFTAEIRGLAHYLQQPKGRLYQYGCDADLGDHRCTVDLLSPAFTATGAITAMTSNRVFEVSGLGSYDTGWFARGVLTFTSGARTGAKAEVKSHENSSGTVVVELWQDIGPPMAGDTFSISAGCDKQIETCRTKFANAVNFRGFPHMPGNDFVAQYVRTAG